MTIQTASRGVQRFLPHVQPNPGLGGGGGGGIQLTQAANPKSSPSDPSDFLRAMGFNSSSILSTPQEGMLARSVDCDRVFPCSSVPPVVCLIRACGSPKIPEGSSTPEGFQVLGRCQRSLQLSKILRPKKKKKEGKCAYSWHCC